jgi:hypothetical protein
VASWVTGPLFFISSGLLRSQLFDLLEEGAAADLGEEPVSNCERPNTRSDNDSVVHGSGVRCNIGRASFVSARNGNR